MHAIPIHPLLAADFTHLAIMLVVLFFGIMKHLFDANKESATKKVATPTNSQQPQRPAQATAQKAKPAVAGQQADPLRSQVEEFLRRAAGPTAADQSPPTRESQQSPSTQIELITNERLRSLGRPAPPTAPQPTAAAREKKQSAPRSSKKRQSVAEHVAERVAARSASIAEMTSHLGQRIADEDKQLDNKLRAKFDHTIGRLTESARPNDETAPPADSPARQIAAMLANPGGIRQAVLLNEILKRPADRW